MQLEVLDFIHSHSDWEERLGAEPYCVKVKRKGDYLLLRYDQTCSDFSQQITRECRGLILSETEDYRPVCVPFFKFGNFGESYVPPLDWSTARVLEKLDGSLVKLWYDQGAWRISSNGEIDARDAEIRNALIPEGSRVSLHELFMQGWARWHADFSGLNQAYTYLFEVVSPYNRIVVKYPEVALWHLSTRDNTTLGELETDIGIPRPHEYPLHNLQDVLAAAHILGDDAEGFVVVDSEYRRMKIKSPRYVALAHLLQGVTTEKSIVELIRSGELPEFLAYFPEYQTVVDDALVKIEAFVNRVECEAASVFANSYADRKSLATVVTKTSCPAYLFALVDGKADSVRTWLFCQPPARICQLIGLG